MLQMTEVLLPQTVITYLDNKQQKIDEQLTYAKKVQKGKDLWDSKSRPQFKKIRLKLDKMCVGQRRCNYCEDSAADEVVAPVEGDDAFINPRIEGATLQELARRKKDLNNRHHATVWFEVKRQRNKNAQIAALFAAASELL